jgi:hypothetical protein
MKRKERAHQTRLNETYIVIRETCQGRAAPTVDQYLFLSVISALPQAQSKQIDISTSVSLVQLQETNQVLLESINREIPNVELSILQACSAKTQELKDELQDIEDTIERNQISESNQVNRIEKLLNTVMATLESNLSSKTSDSFQSQQNPTILNNNISGLSETTTTEIQ